jgi:hypothetical protein
MRTIGCALAGCRGKHRSGPIYLDDTKAGLLRDLLAVSQNHAAQTLPCPVRMHKDCLCLCSVLHRIEERRLPVGSMVPSKQRSAITPFSTANDQACVRADSCHEVCPSSTRCDAAPARARGLQSICAAECSLAWSRRTESSINTRSSGDICNGSRIKLKPGCCCHSFAGNATRLHSLDAGWRVGNRFTLRCGMSSLDASWKHGWTNAPSPAVNAGLVVRLVEAWVDYARLSAPRRLRNIMPAAASRPVPSRRRLPGSGVVVSAPEKVVELELV